MKNLYHYIKNIILYKYYMVLYIDVCSDLHIDQWDTTLEQDFPCGERKYNPLIWDNSQSNILIIAGDVSDNLNLTIEYINKLEDKYEHILFIDGNHEHIKSYPTLYNKEYIYTKINNQGCKNLIYLPYNDFIIDRTVFIGCCGWWDYNNFNNTDIINNLEYFKNWIDHFNISEERDFIYNVYKRSKLEYNELIQKLQKYETNEAIDNIIIVTHTQPNIKFVEEQNMSTELNTKFENITKKKYKKLKYWIFGHTHTQFFEKKDINYICNPRGRPEDYNRENYMLYSFTI